MYFLVKHFYDFNDKAFNIPLFLEIEQYQSYEVTNFNIKVASVVELWLLGQHPHQLLEVTQEDLADVWLAEFVAKVSPHDRQKNLKQVLPGVDKPDLLVFQELDEKISHRNDVER